MGYHVETAENQDMMVTKFKIKNNNTHLKITHVVIKMLDPCGLSLASDVNRQIIPDSLK